MVPLRLALALAFTLVATFGMGVLVYQTTSLGLPWNNSSAESWGEVNKHSDFEKKNGSFNWTSPLSIFLLEFSAKSKSFADWAAADMCEKTFRFFARLRLLHGFMPQLKYFNGITYEASQRIMIFPT